MGLYWKFLLGVVGCCSTNEVNNTIFLGSLLSAIKARSCNDSYAGTSDNVKVHFRNGNSDTCTTNWVTDGEPHPWPTHSWPSNYQKIWTTEEKLGSCASLSFQPINGLEFRLEFDPYGWKMHYNYLKLCHFEADFDTTKFEWDVPEEQGVWSKRDFTEWINMTENTPKNNLPVARQENEGSLAETITVNQGTAGSNKTPSHHIFRVDE